MGTRLQPFEGDWQKIKDFEDAQRATLNMLEDFDTEKKRLEHVQSATLNLLEDFDAEKRRLEDVQRATINILDDFSSEKTRSEQSQRALLNILDDMDVEKSKVAEANQKLETVNNELEAFSYSVSHDLRAPLRAIDGFSLALSEDCEDRLDEQGKDYLQRIRLSAQRMAQLIDDLLNLSRVTRSEMRREKVDLSTLAKSIIEDLRKSEPDRRVQIDIEERLLVDGDERLLRVVLDNLLRNAWKFTSKHERSRIEVGSSGRENGRNVYFVRDDGAGFDMAYAAKLFSPFQRLHSTNEFAGTGIGLASVQRIVHRHGGRAWAEGQQEKGATFYFTL